jgi:hypothetical protein
LDGAVYTVANATSFTSEVSDLATMLKDVLVKDYSWLKEEQEFDYDSFLKGLEWFEESDCPGCRQHEESWCDVKTCIKIKENTVDNCLLCEEFSRCSHTEYQRNRYSYLLEHIEFIKEHGIEEYLREQEKKAEEGVRIQDIRDY